MKVTRTRLAYGSVLVAVPGVLLRACGGPDDRLGRIYARVLGVRQCVEGTVVLTRRDPAWLWRGALVDTIHAVSAVVLASRSTRYRRLALLNAASAAALAIGGARSARG